MPNTLAEFENWVRPRKNHIFEYFAWTKYEDKLRAFIVAHEFDSRTTYAQVRLFLGPDLTLLCDKLKYQVPLDPPSSWTDAQKAAYDPGDLLLKAIRKEYLGEITPQELLAAYLEMKMTPGETVDEYYARHIHVADLCGIEDELRDSQFFRYLLDQNLAKEGIAKRWTPQQLIERVRRRDGAAAMVEGNENAFRPFDNPGVLAAGADSVNQVNNFTRGRGQGPKKKWKKDKSKKAPGGKKSSKTCRYCGTTHTFGKDNCFASTMTCNWCAIPGHLEKQCYKKKNNMPKGDYSQQRPKVQGQQQQQQQQQPKQQGSSQKKKPWQKRKGGGVNNVNNDDDQGPDPGQGQDGAAAPGINGLWGLSN